MRLPWHKDNPDEEIITVQNGKLFPWLKWVILGFIILLLVSIFI